MKGWVVTEVQVRELEDWRVVVRDGIGFVMSACKDEGLFVRVLIDTRV